jgi:hypothetical protein
MKFVIRSNDGHFPDPVIGPPGRELVCYLPDRVDWRQLNYGQGEGQAEAIGGEWGFYWSGEGQMSVILHAGSVRPEAAFRFVRGVAERVAGRTTGFEIVLAGDDPGIAERDDGK